MAAAQGPPELSVEGSSGLAVPGGEVTYHMRLLNWSDTILPGGIISHTLPIGFSYVPGSTQVTVGGWPIAQTDPSIHDGTLVWGPFQLPAAGHIAHNSHGAHTFVQDLCLPQFIDFQLDQALGLVGSGGYVTQLFYRITPATTGPDECAIYFVNAAYDRNLVPILRLQGVWNPVGFWEKPDPGAGGDYAEIANAFARYVAGLPRRNTHPLYITIWNEPDLWIEWSGRPNASEYGHFFVAVSKAVRRLGDPRIRVLNGAVTPTNTTFIRHLLKVPGFASAFDAWASHCYPYNHPPRYNLHQGTARYGNAVIDCYLKERDVIATYGGRTGFKFVIKETGHGLGDNLYAFEGFPPINESNRAGYMSSAFKDYWRKWPEVIAVTPFELGDPWSGWEWLDWINYTLNLDPLQFTHTPHHQYNAVAALDKPKGITVPHGFEVTFRARVDGSLPHDTYTSRLAASASGVEAVPTRDAQVRLVAQVERLYLPRAGVSRNTGVWYMQGSSDTTSADASSGYSTDVPPGLEAGGDGAIIPTHFLIGENTALLAGSQTLWRVSRAFDEAQPRSLALDEEWERVYISFSNGELMVLNLRKMGVEVQFRLDSELSFLTPGPRAGTLYGVSNTSGLILIDATNGHVAAYASPLGRPRGLAFDPQTKSLLVADAAEGAIIRLKDDLSGRLAARALDALPDQMSLDYAGRRLYVLLPGERRVLALDADTLRPLAEAELPGGPLIEMALDDARGRLYVLSALSPRYRGITVLKTDDLSSLALVAGSPAIPLTQATTLALSANGHLLVAEGTRRYQISPEDLDVVDQARLEHPIERGGLMANPVTGQAVWLGPAGVFVEGGPAAP